MEQTERIEQIERLHIDKAKEIIERGTITNRLYFQEELERLVIEQGNGAFSNRRVARYSTQIAIGLSSLFQEKGETPKGVYYQRIGNA